MQICHCFWESIVTEWRARTYFFPQADSHWHFINHFLVYWARKSIDEKLLRAEWGLKYPKYPRWDIDFDVSPNFWAMVHFPTLFYPTIAKFTSNISENSSGSFYDSCFLLFFNTILLFSSNFPKHWMLFECRLAFDY